MRFAIIGAGGYIAPRHMKAIVANGGEIVAACDVHDAVGVLDRYAPDCRFTIEPQEFFQDYCMLADTVVVCTPNHYHVAHARQALDAGCHVVLEKPMAIQGSGFSSADTLIEAAKTRRSRIYPVIQLRYHDEIQALREHFQHSRPSEIAHCEIDYATFRGDWYAKSWKGREIHSGGILVNLGIHLFDLCSYVFGPLISVKSAEIAPTEASGSIRYQHAIVRWRLSSQERQPRRIFKVLGKNIDLSNQLMVLHHKVYEEIIAGRGFSLEDAAQALHAIDQIKAF